MIMYLCLSSSIIDPSDPLSILPLSLSLLSIVTHIHTNAMLFTISPAALIHATIGPDEFALAVLLVLEVLSDVLSLVGPREGSMPVHLVLDPVAFILATILPRVDALPVDIVVQEISFES